MEDGYYYRDYSVNTSKGSFDYSIWYKRNYTSSSSTGTAYYRGDPSAYAQYFYTKIGEVMNYNVWGSRDYTDDQPSYVLMDTIRIPSFLN